jgi:pyruvate dehydrogenase E2 component (dihydrolipoamide acetyltransferase)
MIHNIFIPKLSMTMAEAKLLEWKFKNGDWVEKAQPVLLIESDKVNLELESPASGFLFILAAIGSVVAVGEIAGMLTETKEEFKKLREERRPQIEAAEEEVTFAISAEVQAVPEKREKLKISPVAKAMAQEQGIDTKKIIGSGPGGRIVAADIEAVLKATKMEVAPSQEVYDGKKVKTTIPLTGMRKGIAEHMHRSLSVSAQVSSSATIDMTNMIELRGRLLAREKALGIRVTYTDLFVFVLARALKDNPIINSSLIANEIKIWQDINIGVAVSLEVGEYESGLIVPVVKNADKKSLIEISKTIRELVQKARTGKLFPDDVSGGTFTLSNLAGWVFDLGWCFANPIINQPQSAILGTSGIIETPVVRKGQIVIRPVMPFTLTIDHRVIDGAPAAKFMVKVKDLMENPDLLLI